MPTSNFKDEERLTKLKGKNYPDALKLIYEWVKKDVITFKMFKKYVEEAANNEKRESQLDDDWS